MWPPVTQGACPAQLGSNPAQPDEAQHATLRGTPASQEDP
jgi:hypothetical protein